MTTLEVHVAGVQDDAHLFALPFDVLGPEAELLCQGVASPGAPAHVDLPPASATLPKLYVVARPPRGPQIQATVDLRGGQTSVRLGMERQSPHEWLFWATPFRSLAHLLRGRRAVAPARRIGRVWVRRWRMDPHGHFVADEALQDEFTHSFADDGMRVLELDVGRASELLQIGGDQVAWRFSVLPPRSRVRVALTRKAGAAGDSLDVTVGRHKAMHELLMSYLAQGAIGEASQLGRAWEVADVALYQKYDDPVSATAGAYLLFKLEHLEARAEWLENLVRDFPEIADGAILAAALALRRADATADDVRGLATLALRRGPPVFSLGASILVETLAAVHHGDEENAELREGYARAVAYNRARCSGGAFFAFYGQSPTSPSTDIVYDLSSPFDPSRSPVEIVNTSGRWTDDSTQTVTVANELWSLDPALGALPRRVVFDGLE